jgi:hypothetical protein
MILNRKDKEELVIKLLYEDLIYKEISLWFRIIILIVAYFTIKQYKFIIHVNSNKFR